MISTLRGNIWGMDRESANDAGVVQNNQSIQFPCEIFVTRRIEEARNDDCTVTQ
jgi:hypothetical protein